MRSLLVAALLASAAPAALAAQSVEGALRNLDTGEPVEGATVVLFDTSGQVAVGTVTDPKGAFFLQAPGAGTFFLRVERIGFATPDPVPLRLSRGEKVRQDVRVEAAAVEVEGVEVSAEARRGITPGVQGFYERMRNPVRGGYFVAREKLESYGSAPLSDVLSSVPNMQLIWMPEGHYVMRFRRAAPSVYDQDCPPMWYVDGVPHPVEGDFNRQFSLRELEGIEVYTGARVPPRFGGARAGCGVIVLWTREK